MRSFAVCVLGVVGCGGGGTTPIQKMDMAMQQAMPDLAMQQAMPDIAMQTTCDPVKQDCTSMTDSKCAIVDDGSGMNTLTTKCVAPMGTMMLNQSCTRVNNMPGIDDCAKGLFCSGNGPLLNPVQRHCKQTCSADADCMQGTKCVGLTNNPAPFGFCLGPCTVFGTDCMNGLTCASIIPDIDGNNIMFQCRMVGTGAEGANCMANGDLDCQAGMVCLNLTGMMGGTPTCAVLCDTGHATCTNGKTCKPVMGLTFGMTGGVCQ